MHSQNKKHGAIAQLVEQRTENPCVPGSIPGGTTENQRVTHMSNPSLFLPLCDINSTNNGSPDKPGGLSIQLCKSEKKEFYIRYSS